MRRPVAALALLVWSAGAYPLEGITMWGCAPEGERRSVLYLADRGARSYVKLGTQRVAARVTQVDSARTWTFGTTTVMLKGDDHAEYIENGTVVRRFKCKLMH